MTRHASKLFLLAVLLAPLTASCAANGYRKAESAAAQMHSLRTNLERMGEDLAAVQTSLQSVLAPTGDGTVIAFQAFERQLADVKQRISSADGDLAGIKRRGESYFESWQKQIARIQDGEIRDEAIRRREALLRSQSELVEAVEAVRPHRTALLTSLEDLRIYFSNDLSAAGVDSVRGSVSRIDQDIVALRSRLSNLAYLIDRTAPGFSPAVLATPPNS
ncbi:MAG: DUF2959 family protein [Planctomycetes bacterium]|nr:DUF2959 family protein [Planctomycetota bacterium]